MEAKLNTDHKGYSYLELPKDGKRKESRLFILDEDHQPVYMAVTPENMSIWSDWYDDNNNRCVGDNIVCESPKIRLSTVCLGVDYIGGGKFETAFFVNGEMDDCIRSESWDEADKIHNAFLSLEYNDKTISIVDGNMIFNFNLIEFLSNILGK